MESLDKKTAEAFATSWNNLPGGSVYTKDQFEDWLDPVSMKDVQGKDVLELGCGNGSLLVHMLAWSPRRLVGVDLGGSVVSARKNLAKHIAKNWEVVQDDIVTYNSPGFDLVYCIGVLHHLKDPHAGFQSMVRNTKSGGKVHGWVYAREGNGVVIYLVDPIRKIASRFPWWVTKYLIATPLAIPFYLYANIVTVLRNFSVVKKFPLYEYSLWIARREFSFFRHVAFDQLVTPQTAYIRRETIEKWLSEADMVSSYVIMRNGNSWKFGGIKK